MVFQGCLFENLFQCKMQLSECLYGVERVICGLRLEAAKCFVRQI